MKLLIASDIHGAAGYCRQLLDAWDREGADRLLLLGDVLYHGPRNDLPPDYAPKEVIALLNARKDKIFCVRGNCDTEVDQMVLEFPILADYAVFTAGRRLVYPEGAHIDQFPAANVVRIAFNGGSSYEPLIASLAIDCGVKVNILGADTRNVSGKAFGSMLLGLPQDAAEAARALSYLRAQKDVTVEEVRDYHA